MVDGPLPVTVLRNREVRAAGLRLGDAVVYDWGFELDGRPYEQRSFVLLDDGVQINQPVIFPPERRGWWYCDLVSVADDRDVISVADLWIDVIVGPPDRPYHVLDLDEYGTALRDGALSPDAAIDGLVRFQRFLDRRLGGWQDGERAWRDFPPAAIADLWDVEFPRQWSRISSH